MSDFQIKQGTDGGVVWSILNGDNSPFDLDGYSIRAQIRSTTGNLLFEFSSEIGNVLVAANSITLVWTHTQTTGWRWEEGVFDVEIVSSLGVVTKIDRGFVTLIKEITR